MTLKHLLPALALRLPLTGVTVLTAEGLKHPARSSFGSDFGTALADLAVLYAGQALAENSGVPPERRRTRNTSSAGDEGGEPRVPH